MTPIGAIFSIRATDSTFLIINQSRSLHITTNSLRMKFFTTLVLFVLGVAFAAAAPNKNDTLPVSSRLTTAQILELRRRIQGCNANVCFAIDGSAAIDSANFEAQKLFVKDVIGVLGGGFGIELAAVQYGTSASAISQLTFDGRQVLKDVSRTGQLRSNSTFVAAGINFCFSQLFRRRNEANKIVLLGSGRSTIGPSAIRRADTFRNIGGEVCAVGAGFTDDSELMAIAGGDSTKVFQVNNFLDVLSLMLIVEDMVLEICSDN